MRSRPCNFSVNLLSILVIIVFAINSKLALANDSSPGNQTGLVTVYLTRNAESQTSTTSTGPASKSYNTADLEHKKTVPTRTENSAGLSRDDMCGYSHCAKELSDLGWQRANLLASWFAQRGVVRTLDAVYSSRKVSSYQTVLPTATIADLDVVQLPDGATELHPESTEPSECTLLDAIRNTAPGDTILISGHESTLYDIMGDGNDSCDGLGLLNDDDASSHRFPKNGNGGVKAYGDVWKIVIRDGAARFVYRVNLEATQLTVVDRAR